MGAIANFLEGMMCDAGDTVCQEKMLTYEKYGIIAVVAVVAIVILMMVMKKGGGPTLKF